MPVGGIAVSPVDGPKTVGSTRDMDKLRILFGSQACKILAFHGFVEVRQPYRDAETFA
jgi:hypothetical protein